MGSKLTASALIRHVLLGWLLAVTIGYMALPSELRTLTELKGLARMSFGGVLTGTCLIGGALCVLSQFCTIEKMERWAIVGTFGLLATLACEASKTDAFLALCTLIAGILMIYAIRGWDKEFAVPQIRKAHWSYAATTAALAVGYFLYVSIWTVARVETFSTPSYDFGIFSQMFHYMKTSGQPLTTLERDGLLSHFAVHVSPIYYLLLPVYCLFPKPETLQVLCYLPV